MSTLARSRSRSRSLATIHVCTPCAVALTNCDWSAHDYPDPYGYADNIPADAVLLTVDTPSHNHTCYVCADTCDDEHYVTTVRAR